MASKFTKGANGTGVLHVELTPSEVEPFLGSAAKRLADGLKVPGFRPGMAPRAMVEERIGPAAVLEEAVPSIVSATLPSALDEHDIEIVGDPKIEIDKLAPGNALMYRATVSILPHVSLPREFKLKARHTKPTVEPGALDAALHDLRKLRAKENAVERPAVMGDKLEIDVDVSVDKVPIEGGKSRNHPVILGEGNFIPGFEDKLVGVAVGETKEFALTFPKDYRAANLRGKSGEFRVAVKKIFQLEAPALNDDFAKTLGNFPTLEALKTTLAKNLAEEATTRAKQRFELAIIDELIGLAMFGEIPPLLIDAEIEKMLDELKSDIARKGMKFEDYLAAMKRTEASLGDELRPQGLRRVKTALVLRAIAQRENLDVPDARVEQEMQAFATRTGPSPELETQIRSGDFRRYVKNTLVTQVVMDFLKKQTRDAGV
jgi:trigger factor